jgi:hypothetical protein
MPQLALLAAAEASKPWIQKTASLILKSSLGI